MTRSLFRPSAVRTWTWCALLFAGTALLFSRVTHYGFINYDDPSYVTDNPHVQGGLTWAGVVWAFTAPADYWHPLTWLSHMLDWQIYGGAAAGHHWTNVVIHALNAALAFLVFRRIGGGDAMSAFAAAVFAWHPLRVESVAWITERKDVLSGFFFFLTLLAYARYVAQRRDGGSGWRAYGLTLAAFAAGLMCKPMLVSVPGVLLVLDGWPFRRIDGNEPLGLRNRAVFLEKLPFFALSAATGVATVLLQKHEGAFVLETTLGARGENAAVSIARYLGKFVWPSDLIICYPHPGSWPTATVGAAVVLLIGLSALAWTQRQTRPWLLAGWIWFVMMLLPVLGLVQVGFQAMADRYTYLPLLGIELAIFWTLGTLGRTSVARIGAAVAAGALLLALGVRTWAQEGTWRDSVTLFQHAVDVTNQNPVAEDFLASALIAANRLGDAARHSERAHADDPTNANAIVTLASIREQQGRFADAIALYREALRLRPANPLVQMQLGLLELGRGHADDARRIMLDGLRADGRLRPRTLQLGEMALQRRDPRTARFFYDLVATVDPENAGAHVGLGMALILLGQRDAGTAEWRRALALEPNFPGLREQLAQAEAGGR